MARDHARILTSMHGDPDAQRLEPLEQWVYTYILLARKDINYAGLLSYHPQAWAKACKAATEQMIIDQLAGLEAAGFIVVDRDTFEVLIRSLMRNDGIAKQPNTLVSACRYAMQAESPLIRAALARELRRIAADDEFHLNFPAATAVHDAVAALDPDGPPPPQIDVEGVPPKTSAKGSRKTSAKPTARTSPGVKAAVSASGRSEGFRDDFAEGPGVGEGVGEGESPSGERRVGGTRASARATTPTSPSDDPNFMEQMCGRRHDPEPACRECGKARKVATETADAQARSTAAEKEARQAAKDKCGWCRPYGGWIEHPMTRDPLVRCDHVTQPQFLIARALGETA